MEQNNRTTSSFPSVATASDSLLPMKPGRKPGRKRKQTLCPHSWVQASESVCVAESQPSSRNVVRVRGVGLSGGTLCSAGGAEERNAASAGGHNPVPITVCLPGTPSPRFNIPSTSF
ncbi:uncharacterized protein ACWYII_043062 isoform 3-T4 [Salvelinus alpinus]